MIIMPNIVPKAAAAAVAVQHCKSTPPPKMAAAAAVAEHSTGEHWVLLPLALNLEISARITHRATLHPKTIQTTVKLGGWANGTYLLT